MVFQLVFVAFVVGLCFVWAFTTFLHRAQMYICCLLFIVFYKIVVIVCVVSHVVCS